MQRLLPRSVLKQPSERLAPVFDVVLALDVLARRCAHRAPQCFVCEQPFDGINKRLTVEWLYKESGDTRPDEVGYPAIRERNHRDAAGVRLEVHQSDRLAQAREGEDVRRVVVGSQLTVLDGADEHRRTFKPSGPLFEL